MHRGRDEEFWFARVREWRSSGESVAGFARNRSLPEWSLRYWVKKVERGGRSDRGVKPVRLLPIRVRSTSSPGVVAEDRVGRIEVIMGDVVIRFEADVEPTYVARLCAAMAEARC